MFKILIIVVLLFLPSISYSQDYIIPRDTSNYWNYDGYYQGYAIEDSLYYFKSALFIPTHIENYNITFLIRKYNSKNIYSEQGLLLTEQYGKVFYNGYSVYDSTLTSSYETIEGGVTTRVTLSNQSILGKIYKVQTYYRHYRNMEYYSILEVKIAKGLGIIYLNEIEGVGAGSARGPEYTLKSCKIDEVMYGDFKPEFINDVKDCYINTTQLVRFLFRTKEGPYKLDLIINEQVYSTDTVNVNSNQKIINIPDIISSNCKLKLTSLIDSTLTGISNIFSIKGPTVVPIIPRDTSNYWNYDGDYQAYVPSDSIYYFKSALLTPKNDSTFIIRKYKTNIDYSEEEVHFIQKVRKLFYKGITIYDDDLTSGYDTTIGGERTLVTLSDTVIFGNSFKVQNVYRFNRVGEYYSILEIKTTKGLGITYWKEMEGIGAGTAKGPIYRLRSFKVNNNSLGDFNPEFITQMQGTYISGTNILVRFVIRTKTGPYKMDLLVNNKVHSSKVISNVDTNCIEWVLPEVNSDSCQLRIIYFSNSTLRALSDTFSIHTPLDVNEDNLITEYHLYQNYPNPFNPSSKIKYSIKEESIVRLTIYNSLGEVVKYFGESIKAPGVYEENFDASSLSSGIYLYRVEAKSLDGKINFTDTKKMMLLK